MPHKKRTASGVLGGLLGLVGLSAVAGLLITATVTPAIALSGAAASSAITMFDNLPSVLKIDKLMLPTTIYAKKTDGDGWVQLAKFYDQNRSPVKFEQVAPVMYDAVLSSEDPRYYQHGGVDLIGTSRAMYQTYVAGGETQGGSSISQQYVKNILIQRCEINASTDARTQLNEAAEKKAADTGEKVVAPTSEELRALTDEVLANCATEAITANGTEGVQRKLQEMRYAIALEQEYSKNTILLGYLNIANFGGTTYGIDAAARYYFGTTAAKLTVAQAATLAGMVQNPNTYRIDQPKSETNGKANGVVEAGTNTLAALTSLLNDGKITQEQYDKAGDAYGETKGRQLYVLSRMLDDGKITQDQYVEAAIAPIKPKITKPTTGCGAAKNAEYFCQYVKDIIRTDEAFGETPDDRLATLQRGGLKIYTTLDYRVQNPAVETMKEWTPTSVEGMTSKKTGIFGSTAVSIEADTGRILAIAQNTEFSESSANDDDVNFSSLVYAGDLQTGGARGFNAGSTFKLFTLVDWLEKGHSVNETLNGRNRIFDRVTSCEGDWVNMENTRVQNFNNAGGYYGTPMRFTRDSLNSGYFAMAQKLDLCDIQATATKMGVTRGDGTPIQMKSLFSVVGSESVSPIAMAGAYATVANGGTYCEPKAIDKVVGSDGEELPIPKTECNRVLEPEVAATAAYALAGVMASGGTGSASNPWDGTPLIGKTGTHQTFQTWMVESSTAVATAVWVGNTDGEGNLFNRYYKGWQMSQLRHKIAPAIQRVADEYYPGSAFPQPDTELTKRVLTNLPNVVGMTVEQATSTLRAVGFSVTVGDAVDSADAEGIVAEQSPGAGRVAGGANITISPSNGQGTEMPNVVGQSVDDASNALRSAGFTNVSAGRCTEDESVKGRGQVTATNPESGETVNRNSSVRLDYSRDKCGDE